MIMGDGPLSIPNAFTPHNDGVNDKWQIQSIDKYKDAIVRIFDKSGKLIYQSPPGYPNPWDGTSQGEQMPMGTDFYIISADPGSEPLKGSLTLIR